MKIDCVILQVSLLHRIADPIAKRTQRGWLAQEKADLFIQNMAEDVTKADVYEAVKTTKRL